MKIVENRFLHVTKFKKIFSCLYRKNFCYQKQITGCETRSTVSIEPLVDSDTFLCGTLNTIVIQCSNHFLIKKSWIWPSTHLHTINPALHLWPLQTLRFACSLLNTGLFQSSHGFLSMIQFNNDWWLANLAGQFNILFHLCK